MASGGATVGRNSAVLEMMPGGRTMRFYHGCIILSTPDSSAQYEQVSIKRRGERVTLQSQGKMRVFVVPLTFKYVRLTESGDLYRDDELVEKGVVPPFAAGPESGSDSGSD